MSNRVTKLFIFALLMCGCATTGYTPSPAQSPAQLASQREASNAPVGVTHSCSRQQILRGDPFPLKLSPKLIQSLGTLNYDAESREWTEAFRARFQRSGDYPVFDAEVGHAITVTLNTNLWVQGIRHSAMKRTVGCTFTGGIQHPSIASQSINLAKQTQCEVTSKFPTGSGTTDAPAKHIAAVREAVINSFAVAANELLRELESKRDQLDDIHSEFLFSN